MPGAGRVLHVFSLIAPHLRRSRTPAREHNTRTHTASCSDTWSMLKTDCVPTVENRSHASRRGQIHASKGAAEAAAKAQSHRRTHLSPSIVRAQHVTILLATKLVSKPKLGGSTWCGGRVYLLVKVCITCSKKAHSTRVLTQGHKTSVDMDGLTSRNSSGLHSMDVQAGGLFRATSLLGLSEEPAPKLSLHVWRHMVCYRER